MSDQQTAALAVVAGTFVACGGTLAGIGANEAAQAHNWHNVWFPTGVALMALSLLIGLLMLSRRRSDGQDQAGADSSGRVFTNTAPGELTKIFAENNHIQALKIIKPYLGQWLRVQGKVDDVDPFGIGGARLFLAKAAGQPFFDLRFGDKKPLSLPRKGTPLVAIGRIRTVTSTRVSLSNCRLESVGGIVNHPTVEESERADANLVLVNVTDKSLVTAQVTNGSRGDITQVGVYIVDKANRRVFAKTLEFHGKIASQRQRTFTLERVSRTFPTPISYYCIVQFTDAAQGIRWNKFMMGRLDRALGDNLLPEWPKCKSA
jgi:hypothetical protein